MALADFAGDLFPYRPVRLKLRQTWADVPDDYAIMLGPVNAGRIRLVRMAGNRMRWHWYTGALYLPGHLRPGHGEAESLADAKRKFMAGFLRWLEWAGEQRGDTVFIGAPARAAARRMHAAEDDEMCNRYQLNSMRDEIGRLFRVAHNRMEDFPGQLTLFPGAVAPVIRLARDGERELVNLNWGFILWQSNLAPKRVTNVRDDTIRTSGFWKHSYDERRCLVPVSSFAEPRGLKPATWFWFALNGGKPRPVFAFAGIWRTYRGRLKKDGEPAEQDVFAFMTTQPNSLVATINHQRMPVILTQEDEFATWLGGKADDAYSLVRQYPAERMRIAQAGLGKEDKLGEVTPGA